MSIKNDIYTPAREPEANRLSKMLYDRDGIWAIAQNGDIYECLPMLDELEDMDMDYEDMETFMRENFGAIHIWQRLDISQFPDALCELFILNPDKPYSIKDAELC